jgi:hypothetical protein
VAGEKLIYAEVAEIFLRLLVGGNMSKRPRSRRRVVPTYVSITTLAAELEISMPTALAWLREGRLPPCEPGSPASSRRWRWSKVEAWMAGDRSSDLFAGRGKPRGPKPGAANAGRPKKPGVDAAPPGELRVMTSDEFAAEFESGAYGEPWSPESVPDAQQVIDDDALNPNQKRRNGK